jgi:hypothetical protein
MQRFIYPSFIFSAILGLILVIDSCVSHDIAQYTCTNPSVSYNGTVKGIVETKCAISGCHDGKSPNGIPNWSDFTTFQNRASDVKRRVLAHEMPPPDSPNGPLDQAQISNIACWVDQGAHNN